MAQNVVVTVSDEDNVLQAASEFMGGGERIGSKQAEFREEDFVMNNTIDNFAIVDLSHGKKKLGFNITGHHLLCVLLPCLLLIHSACAMNSQPEIKGNPDATECVVLLHGLARTYNSMNTMEKALIRAGYQTVNLDYPSRLKPIENIAEEEFALSIQLCEQAGAQKIHFVTHSLGGIVVRYAMAGQKLNNLGRVVMLSPPNKGSFVTDKLKNRCLYKWLNGPAGQDLGTEDGSLPNRLGPVDYEVGVIIGNRYWFFDAWFASYSPGEHDGKVSVQAARVEGMADFLIVPETHPFIMNADRVIEETIHFLRQGTFSRP